MTLADDLKQTVYDGRGIAGGLGFRPYRVYILRESFDSDSDDSAFAGSERVEITEGNGQPPRVKLTGDNAGFGNAAEMLATIGPLTPAFPGGGTDILDLTSVEPGRVRHVFITGPDLPTGARFRITHVNADRVLGYVVSAQAESEALKGY